MSTRNTINLNLLKNFLFKHGLYGNVELLSVTPETLKDWKWSEANEWPGKCRDGKHQSPVAISESEAVNSPNMRYRFCTLFSAMPKLEYNGHEVEISGKQGCFTHQLEIGQRTFFIDKTTFKFPAEHSIDGHKYDGEIIFQGKTKDVIILNLI